MKLKDLKMTILKIFLNNYKRDAKGVVDMKNLQTIQKTTKVFRIHSLVAMICSFAGALIATGIWAAYGTQVRIKIKNGRK